VSARREPRRGDTPDRGGRSTRSGLQTGDRREAETQNDDTVAAGGRS